MTKEDKMNDQTLVPATKRGRVLDTMIRIEAILAIAALVLLAVIFTKPVLGAISAIHAFFTTSDM